MFEKSQRIFKRTAARPFLFLGYPWKGMFSLCLFYFFCSCPYPCSSPRSQVSAEVEAAAFAVPHLPRVPSAGAFPGCRSEGSKMPRQSNDGLAALGAGSLRTAPGWRGATCRLLGEHLLLCVALGTAVLPQRGERQKGRNRGWRLLCTLCQVLIDGVWGAALNFILVRQQLSWAIDDGLKNVMRIKYFYILVFRCFLALRKLNPFSTRFYLLFNMQLFSSYTGGN